MAQTKTSTSNFSSAIVDYFINKKVQEHGQSDYIFRNFADKDAIDQGNGQNWKVIRYERLELPAALTEGTSPTAQAMTVNTVTGSVSQRGMSVEITDLLERTQWSKPRRFAVREVADSMARDIDKEIQLVVLAGTNVKYGNGAASRDALAATDVLNSTDLRKAASLLMHGAAGGVDGGAKPFANGKFAFLVNDKHYEDLLDDPVIQAKLVREPGENELVKGYLGTWANCDFYRTNFGPELQGLSAAASGWAIAETAGTTYDNAAVITVGYVATHKKRGFAEVMWQEDHTMTAQKNLQLTTPTSTDYTYDVYSESAADGSGTLKLVASGQAGATAVAVSALPTGAAPPTKPAAGITVYTSYLFGKDAFAYITGDALKSYVVTGASKSDPLDQKVVIGSKRLDGSLILNNNFFCRLEAPSAYV